MLTLSVLMVPPGGAVVGSDVMDACYGVCTAYSAMRKSFRGIRGGHDQWLQKDIATHRIDGAQGCWIDSDSYECVWDYGADHPAALSRYHLLLSEVRVCLGELVQEEHMGLDGRDRSVTFTLADKEAQVLVGRFLENRGGVEFAGLRFMLRKLD